MNRKKEKEITCQINFQPSIILSPEYQEMLENMFQQTWIYFVSKIYLPSLEKKGEKNDIQ